ncbi:MAG: hypothetical protein EBS14_03330 [Burkholderiaceae bacterium]|nr:hypothetical protein [Burkholderiaceae bacterium]NBX99011.1 hypothetical protein [Burkholderiaceae bacterium]
MLLPFSGKLGLSGSSLANLGDLGNLGGISAIISSVKRCSTNFAQTVILPFLFQFGRNALKNCFYCPLP